ncbi:MAG: helix-turn-helix transcriptional regulator [Corallococcus sp.]|nr:helix-turn-helix transcriptional regulator [Corallococcus sp.]
MAKMLNFKTLLNNVLVEQNKTFAELENCGVIGRRAFYQYKNYVPHLSTVIKIANHLQVSLDYLTGRTNDNGFRTYKTEQTNFYYKLIGILKSDDISQSEMSREIPVSRPNFTYWKQGKLPKLETLVAIANYLNCSIDDLLDLE